MKKKYYSSDLFSDKSLYGSVGEYININDAYSDIFNDWTFYEGKPNETEEQRLAREKMEKRDKKIELILGNND